MEPPSGSDPKKYKLYKINVLFLKNVGQKKQNKIKEKALEKLTSLTQRRALLSSPSVNILFSNLLSFSPVPGNQKSKIHPNKETKRKILHFYGDPETQTL